MHALTSARHHPLLNNHVDEILTIFENNHIDPPWSHLLVLGLDVLAIAAVAWCVREFYAAQRAARQASRMEKSTLPLHERARFVAGHVELAEGSKTAIRVTIKQTGTQREYKKKFTHTWTEIDRHVEASPFYLRLGNGERVRVEPPPDVMLVDKLDQMEWFEMTHRRRRAELVAEERAVIEGVLERGADPEVRGGPSYREHHSTGWIMRPTKRQGMRVSTEGLARRHELRARAFFWTAILTVLLGLGAMGVVLPYRLRLFFGKNIVAKYLGKETITSRSGKGNVRTSHGVRIQFEDTRGLIVDNRFEVDRDDYSALPYSTGKIWFRHVASEPRASALGKNSSVASWQLIIAAVVLGYGFYRIVRTHRYRRWYEGPLIQEGSGVLPVPPNIRFPAEEIKQVLSQPQRTTGPTVDRISADFTDEVPKQE